MAQNLVLVVNKNETMCIKKGIHVMRCRVTWSLLCLTN